MGRGVRVSPPAGGVAAAIGVHAHAPLWYPLPGWYVPRCVELWAAAYE